MLMTFSQNVALLLALSLLYSFIVRTWRQQALQRQIVAGILFGMIAVIGMTIPWQLDNGVFFDARTIIISVAGLYGGVFTAVIASVIAIGYRLLLGGAGVWIGMATITSALLFGVIAHHYYRSATVAPTTRQLLLFGIALHTVCVVWFTLLPPAAAHAFFHHALLPYLLLSTAATAALGFLLNDVQVRIHTEQQLHASEQRFRRLFENAEVSIWNEDFTLLLARLAALRAAGMTDLRAYLAAQPELAIELAGLVRVTAVNTATCELLTAPSPDALLTRIDKTFGTGADRVFMEGVYAVWENRALFRSEVRLRRFDGQEIDVLMSCLIPRHGEDCTTVPVTFVDITANKIATARVARLTHLYQALNACHQAILHCNRAEELFPLICQNVVTQGNLAMAWVGQIAPETGLIHAIAVYGDEYTDYVPSVRICIDPNDPYGNGPTALAWRTQTPQWCQSIADDERMTPWRFIAASAGWQASAALPLHHRGHIVAVLNVYSCEVNAFDEEVRHLLTELAATVSYALDYLATQRELADAEERWKFAVEGNDDGVWDWDLRTNTVFFSARWKQMLGFAEDELNHTLETWSGRVHPDDLNRVMADIERHLHGETRAYRNEHRVRCKDGHYKWILDRGKIMATAPDGQPLRMLGTHTDITAVRATRNAIARLGEIVDKVQMEIYVIDVVTLRFVQINEGARLNSGYERDELLAMTVLDIKPGMTVERFAQLTAPLTQGEMKQVIFETSHRRKNGTRYPVEVRLQLLSSESTFVALVVDVTERRQVEQSLRASETRFRTAIEASPVPVMIHTEDQRILAINRAWTTATGYHLLDVPTFNDWLQHIHLAADTDMTALFDALYHEELAEITLHGTVICHNNEERLWDINTALLTDGPPGQRTLISVAQDVTQAKQYERQLEQLAHFDVLTGLPNRLLLTKRLDQIVSESLLQQRQFALLFLDLDHFKTINDSLGHPTGDQLLCAVTARLTDVLAPTDLLARLGGDEFVILQTITQVSDPLTLAEQIITRHRVPYPLAGGYETMATLSIGVSIFPDDATDAMTLIKYADTAMYAAKNAGRNRVCRYTPALSARADARLNMEIQLRQGLAAQELVVYLQPLIDLADGALVAAECLVRWQRPSVGLIPPDRFIPVAEETGLIVAVGQFVLEQACAFIASWNDGLLAHLRLAVNVSGRQFEGDLAANLAQLLARSGIDHNRLEVEITESVLMAQVDHQADVLMSLRRLGIRLSIDDFGTGYSSLAYLKNFKIDKLKIDRSFVIDLPHDHDDGQIVSTIIGMAHNLGLEVVAEGIESAEQAAYLRSIGCDLGQGYLFSRPLPLHEFVHWANDYEQQRQQRLRLQSS